MFIVRFRGRVVEHVDAEFPDRRQRAIAFILERGGITSSQYRALFGLGERQAAKDLTTLAQSGVLVRVGKGRSTRYVLPKTDAKCG